MNETQTRLDLIDPALKAVGWGSVAGSRIRVEYPITDGMLIGNGRKANPLKADYVLIYKNRKLAVIEAKKQQKHYTEGLSQAKNYANRLNIRYAYSTNGIKIYGRDMVREKEGDVETYPSPDELWEMTFAEQNEWRDKLMMIPYALFAGKWQPRYYQQHAVEKVIEAIANGEDRILLTMATGTGKTATSFQIAWKLFEAKWNLSARERKEYFARIPRILFLADRNLLANQAFNSFNSFNKFEEEALVRITPAEIRKKGSVPTNGSIFFTIFQSFMSGDDGDPYFDDYPRDFFDFIIIDECHRGGANDESSWRGIMDHFDAAVQLGLTATPKRKFNADTYDYFGDPVFQYSLKEGINDGFLSPFRVKEIDDTLTDYIYTLDDEVIQGEIEEGQQFGEKDFNRKVEIVQREALRVKLFMDSMDQNEKTMVFCQTQDHALLVRNLINQYTDIKSNDYCHRVTADDGAEGEKQLKYFQDNEKTIPTILTTSQKLSTGVDAPQLRNIVLMRPVTSMIEFKQIVGRGTRLYEGKDYFTIYDFVEAHEHFQDPAWDGKVLPPEEPTGTRTCTKCNQSPCKCDKPEKACKKCGNTPCDCEAGPKQIVKIKLGNHHEIEYNATIKTSFWSPDGKPIGSQEFIKNIFGEITTVFESEEALRKVWSAPDTRTKLLQELDERGYGEDQLRDLKEMIHAKDCDLFDALSYIAYHTNKVPRLKRSEAAKIHISNYSQEQQEFLNFVLKQYVDIGVSELNDQKLPEIIELKYGSVADAKAAIGSVVDIRNAFVGFQKFLYEKEAG